MKLSVTHLALITLLGTTSFSLSAADPCQNPVTPAEKNACNLKDYLSRYDSALSALNALVQGTLSTHDRPAFQKDQAAWSQTMNQKIKSANTTTSTEDAQNTLAKDYATRLQNLTHQYAAALKTSFFEALKNPFKNKEQLNNLFYFIAAKDFKDPFSSPANLALQDTFFDLKEGQYLFAHTTSFGANQGAWVPYLVNATSKTITPLTWETCENNAIQQNLTLSNNDGICGFSKYNATTKEIINFCKSGCAGTNGVETIHKIEGNTLKIQSALSKDVCDGKPFSQGAKPVCGR